jgi:NAD+ kinase
VILADPHNPKAQAMRDQLAALLPDDIDLPSDFVVVFGGDGFLLRTVADRGLQNTYLGLNAGHLGFLLNDVVIGPELVNALVKRTWRVHRHRLLEADLKLVDGSHKRRLAINDIYLERSTGQAARMRLKIDDQLVVDGLVSDGLVFATALGSTAYAYSAGGQPFHPSLDVLQVTPICPHKPRLTPFALPPSARAQVDVIHHEWRPVRAVADGRGVEGVLSVQVGLSETELVSLAYLPSHDFTRQMLRKIVSP